MKSQIENAGEKGPEVSPLFHAPQDPIRHDHT